MTPDRAYAQGVRSETLRVTADAGRAWGRWEVWAPDARRENGRRVLTSFAHDSIQQACRWVATLQRLEVAGAAVDNDDGEA